MERALTRLEHDVRSLMTDVLEMGANVESMFSRASLALAAGNVPGAQQVIASDDEIDQAELEIERQCIMLLAEGPLGNDLRRIEAALKIVTDLERLADLAVDLARSAIRLQNFPETRALVDVTTLASRPPLMLRIALRAWFEGTAEGLMDVVRLEDATDEETLDAVAGIQRRMGEGGEDLQAMIELLFAVHHVERAADLAFAIADRVSFAETGRLKSLPGSLRGDREAG
ncbi:MAG: phosphate signaling complex protein PhoU [Fimbriimonadaceae bacterium]|nr:phosphate signaling complex protein PhoU [Fimbriimonadaceae bacterium]